MLNILFLIGGLILILVSANWLVDGASMIAKKWGISDIVVGLTIVAFGTSAPELVINIFSALNGATDLAIGNILGSNICNVLLILGISAIIYPISINANTKWKEIPLSLLAVLVLGIMANDVIIDKVPESNVISRIDGLILLCFFIIFLVYTFEISRHSKLGDNLQGITPKTLIGKPISLSKAFFFIILGLTGLFFGGKYLVLGAVEIAHLFGMTEKVIGLTIIAVGTSLPELATSVVAAIKKKSEIAVGNIVGSNIFNVFFILGVTSIIKPIPFDSSINFDILVAMLASILLFFTTIVFGFKKIVRIEGIIFLVIYVCYISYTLISL
jgi:cation:H+ antiporter